MTSSLILLFLGFQQPWSSPLPPTRPVPVDPAAIGDALVGGWPDLADAEGHPAWGLFRLAEGDEWTEVSPPGRLRLAELAAETQGWSGERALAWLAENERPRLRLRYVLRDSAGDVLLEGVDEFRPGETHGVSAAAIRTVVDDYDVEIASGTAVVDPVVALVGEGPSLQVALAPAVGVGWLARVRLAETVGEDVGDVRLGARDVGDKPRFSHHVLEADWRTLLRPGREETLEVVAPDGRGWMLALTLEGPDPVGPRPFGDDVWLDLPVLPGDDWESLAEDLVGGREVLAVPEAGAVVLTGPGAADRAAWAARRIAERFRSGPAAVTWEEAGAVGALAWSVAAPTLVGSRLRVRVGREFQVLTDWEVEVAQESRIADPVFALVFDGLTLEAFTRPSADGLVPGFRGERSFVHLGEPRLLLLAAERKTSGQTGGEPAILPPVTANLEEVSVMTMRFGSEGADADGLLTERSFLDGEGRPYRIRVRADDRNGN